MPSRGSQLPSLLLRHGRGVFSYRPGEPLEGRFFTSTMRPAPATTASSIIVGSYYRLEKSVPGFPGRADAAGAETALRRALLVGAESAAAHANLGAILAARRSLAEARYHFEQAIRTGPENAGARTA